MKTRDFIQVEYAEPHLNRTLKILKAHPEISKLYGYTPSTAWFVYGLVALQTVLAVVIQDQPWWAFLLLAYTVGAAASHALFILIHDATHNLIFKTSLANRWIAIVANLPFIFPAAMGFREYHLIHHKYQGEMEYDADLAPEWEARVYSGGPFSALKKMIWFVLFPIHYGITRPLRLKKIYSLDKWAIINTLAVAAYVVIMQAWTGWTGVAYLFVSACFSIGLHPLGARWIQEHFVFHQNQETYSYYGPLNKIAFNVGFHNEHHDFMGIPWSRLPKVRATAPEFYDTLYYHKSWTGLILRFIFDPKVDFYSRVVRPSHKAKSRLRAESLTAPGGLVVQKSATDVSGAIPASS
ncbi:MAG: fatty acid desaturase [Bacteriovoracia bacterium]